MEKDAVTGTRYTNIKVSPCAISFTENDSFEDGYYYMSFNPTKVKAWKESELLGIKT